MNFEVLLLEDLGAPIKNAIVGGPFGSNLVSKDYVEFGIPVIRGQNMGGKIVGGAFVFVTQEKANSLSQNKARPGDIVFTQRGTLGQVSIVPAKPYSEYIVSQSQMKITLDPEKADVNFIYYLFKTEIQLQYILNAAIQTGVPHTNLGILRKTPVVVPPLEIQMSIARILSSLDDRIALLRETNATLEAMAQALFKSWFVDFDPVHANAGTRPASLPPEVQALFPSTFTSTPQGLVPEGWKLGSVANLGDVICGKTPPTSELANYGDDVPFITIPDMHGKLTVTSTARSLSKLGASLQAKKFLRVGSVCVSCIATPGLVVKVTEPSQTNQQINSVVPFPEWGDCYPLFALQRVGELVRAEGSGGSVFYNLSKTGFEKIPMLLPKNEVIKEFERIAASLVDKIIDNQKQAQTLATLRDTLLPRLISGQLRLPDAEAVLAEAVA